MIVSVQKAVTSDPPDSSAKGVSVLLYEVLALVWVSFWEEYFGLSVVR